MTQGGRRGRSNAPLRGVHHQTDLEDTPHDSSVSPPCRMRQPGMTEGRPSNVNEKKDRKGQSAKPSLKNLSSLSDSGAYVQWKESLNYYGVAGWNDMDLLPYAFNSLTREVGKLALTFGRGLPLRELITELDEHFGIIADLDTLRREFFSMKQGTHEMVSQFAGRVDYQLHWSCKQHSQELYLNVMKKRSRRGDYMAV